MCTSTRAWYTWTRLAVSAVNTPATHDQDAHTAMCVSSLAGGQRPTEPRQNIDRGMMFRAYAAWLWLLIVPLLLMPIWLVWRGARMKTLKDYSKLAQPSI